jgi:sphingomyelin phosphodiesterase 2
MVERHPVLGCSLSDHFSVEATLVWRPLDVDDGGGNGGNGGVEHEKRRGTATVSTASNDHYRREVRREMSMQTIIDENDDDALQNGAYLESPTGSDFRVAGNVKGPENGLAGFAEDSELPPSTYDEILAVIDRYVAREKTQQRWRGLHFLAWVVVTIASLVAVWFVPRNFVAFILMLLSSLGLMAGTVDGLIALLFVNTELAALKEFEWEIRNAKAVAGGGPPMVDDLGDEQEPTGHC